MGLLGKIKNILFEEDDEVEEMPVYTKEDVKELPKKEETIDEEIIAEPEPPITTSENSRFRNVKRDIDLFEDDVLDEVPGVEATREQTREVLEVKEEPAPVVEEKKSVFPSFDEDEFDRFNGIEQTRKEVVRRIDVPVSNDFARQANGNFSSTNTLDSSDKEKYRINTGTVANGKKPFTPSPVISPVYGILDKNYTKDDIVDRKGGMKREKVVKPVVKSEEPKVEETDDKPHHEEVKVSIDTVREKAYGNIEETPVVEKPRIITREEETKTVEEVPVEKLPKIEEIVPEKVTPEEIPEVEPVSIEDQIEDEIYDADTKLDAVVEEVLPEEKKEEDTPRPKAMDEMEKTSTLQILDDIEKELSAIKPISKEAEEEENKEIKEHKVNMDDTLENDLFNLIDSMYEEGEDDDD